MGQLQNACCDAPSKTNQTELDASFNGLFNETDCLESAIIGLRRALEVPNNQLEGSGCEGKNLVPETIVQAHQLLYNRIREAAEQVNRLTKRVEEQVGELKLLP
jgi:hypothetical protein